MFLRDCLAGVVTSVCRGKALLYDLEADLGERHDLSATNPHQLAVMLENDRSWSASIAKSIAEESKCPTEVRANYKIYTAFHGRR